MRPDPAAAEHAAWIVPEWPAPPGVHAVTTTRDTPGPSPRSGYGFNVGTGCGDPQPIVSRNRASLRQTLSLPAEPCWLQQVHGTRVVAFDHPPPPLPEADAALTRTPGMVLAIQSADCLPVLFCSGAAAGIAAVHAGWRGLATGVLEATLDALPIPRGEIMAWLGPAIAAESYEVGDEVRDAFGSRDRAAHAAFKPTRPGHWSCDLYQLARQRLRAAGVHRIYGGSYDTFTDRRLHSARRDGRRSGRMVSLIWRVA
jgi:YfiH family protein